MKYGPDRTKSQETVREVENSGVCRRQGDVGVWVSGLCGPTTSPLLRQGSNGPHRVVSGRGGRGAEEEAELRRRTAGRQRRLAEKKW